MHVMAQTVLVREVNLNRLLLRCDFRDSVDSSRAKLEPQRCWQVARQGVWDRKPCVVRVGQRCSCVLSFIFVRLGVLPPCQHGCLHPPQQLKPSVDNNLRFQKAQLQKLLLTTAERPNRDLQVRTVDVQHFLVRPSHYVDDVNLRGSQASRGLL